MFLGIDISKANLDAALSSAPPNPATKPFPAHPQASSGNKNGSAHESFMPARKPSEPMAMLWSASSRPKAAPSESSISPRSRPLVADSAHALRPIKLMQAASFSSASCTTLLRIRRTASLRPTLGKPSLDALDGSKATGHGSGSCPNFYSGGLDCSRSAAITDRAGPQRPR